MGKIRKQIYGGFSTSHAVSFMIDNHVVSSFRDSAGDMYRKVFEVKENRPNRKDDKLYITLYVWFIIVSIIAQVIAFIEFPVTRIVVGVFEFLGFLKYSSILVRAVGGFREQEDSDKVMTYHGAEHKVFNAGVKLGRTPTLDEARKEKRFSPWCGVKLIGLRILFFLLNTILAFSGFYVLPCLMIDFLASAVPGYDPFTYFAQMFFTTAEPSDQELKVSIDAFNAAIEISNGRKTTSDEIPTVETAEDYVTKLLEEYDLTGYMTKEQENDALKVAERLDFENEVVQNIVRLTWKKWVAEFGHSFLL